MRCITVFLLVGLYFNQCVAAVEDKCKYRRCGDCISSTDNCVWCSQDNVEDGDQCRPASSINTISSKQWCKKDLIEFSKVEWNVTKDDDFNAGGNGTIVQFRPQHIKLTGGPGQSIPIEMSYKPAKHYPLDVYYLMDNSYTMKDHLNALKDQAYQIYTELTNLTNNVRLGVGSFIEKPAFPYFDENTKDISYVFKNLVTLTNDTALFETAINNISLGSNYDDPEAGLDALMQVMTCNKELGWRERSRKFIVLCTDSTYHSAGDGKMIGIIKPNDMKCHFENNTYTKALEHDYPSVSQINNVAKEGGFQVIFAVVNYTTEYKALARQILGAKYAALNKEDSSVVKIIRDIYTEAVSYVELDSELNKHVELTLEPDCRKGSKNKEGCGVTHNKPIVKINGLLKIKSCPGVDRDIGKIAPIGLKEKLTVEINYNCKCKCENEGGDLVAKCNNVGFLQCGLCECIKPSYGTRCQCNGTSSDKTDYEKCIKKGDKVPCSGKGHCRCGKCEQCEKDYSGEFCEFDDTACPHPNKNLCSGHGKCTLGKCHCYDHWQKDDCSCPGDDTFCKAPQSNNVCSGNGKCVCGVCECNKIEGKNESYSGVFCDTCDECAEERCRELEDYAYCNYLKNKTICDHEYNAKNVSEVHLVNKTEINAREWYTAKWCKKVLDDGSHIVFKYKYNGTDLILVIQKEPELPPKANIWIPVGSAIGVVLLVGLLTVVIWKILIDMHDAREYKKFADQSAAAGFNVDNPLYESPATEFANPAYCGSKK